MIKTFFKDSNIDLDRTKVINTPNCIYVDGYFFPEDEKCPICNSSDLQKNGHIKRTVKHCVYYSSLILVTCHFQLYCCKNCNHKFQEKNTFSKSFIGSFIWSFIGSFIGSKFIFGIFRIKKLSLGRNSGCLTLFS